MQEAQCGFPSPDSYMLGVSSPCTASCPVPQLPPLGSPSISTGGVPPRLCLTGQSTPPAMREAHLSLSLTQGSDVGPPLPGSQHQPPACQNAWRQGLPWDGRDQHRTSGQPRAEDGKGSPGSPRRAAGGRHRSWSSPAHSKTQPRDASAACSPPAWDISVAQGDSSVSAAIPLPAPHGWEEGPLCAYSCSAAFISMGSAEDSKGP